MNRVTAAALNIAFALLAALGILTALFGISIDIILGTRPGLSWAQLTLIAAGLLCSLIAFPLRRPSMRRRVWAKMRKHWLPALIIAAAALIALEFALAAAGISPYFPPAADEPPPSFYQPAPWWTCGEAGCHHVYEQTIAACDNGEIDGRRCIVNRQGFHDTQDFTASDDLNGRTRILMLGDSFTFGASADIGKSYVETIESNFPQTIVWNAAVSATATQQALASFQVYAPILQPQLAILGFSANDFTDNLFPMDRFLRLKAAPNRAIQQYRIDHQGNAIQLDRHQLYHYAHGVEPPASEIERLIGTTRLGAPALKMLDMLRGGLFESALTTQAIDLTRGYLRALQSAAAAQDTALLVLLVPARADIDAPGLRYQTARQLMQELKIPWLDPIHALDAELDYEPVDDPHWNTAGHQKIGALLSDCLAMFHISQDLADCQQVKMP